MFLTTKLNLLSGMIIGASAVLLMKEMCKGRCKQKQDHRHKHDSHTNGARAKYCFLKKLAGSKI